MSSQSKRQARCSLLAKDTRNVKIRCRCQKDFSLQKCSSMTAFNVAPGESNLSKSSNLNSNLRRSQTTSSTCCLMSMAQQVLSALCLAATLTSPRLQKVNHNEAVVSDSSLNHRRGFRLKRNHSLVISSRGPLIKLPDKHPSHHSSHRKSSSKQLPHKLVKTDVRSVARNAMLRRVRARTTKIDD